MSGQPAQRRRSVVLITGASGGIGAELARVFACHGHDLALVARNGAQLETLAAEIERSGRPRPIVVALDLSDPTSGVHLSDTLEAQDASVNMLVNNAGFGLVGPAHQLDPSEQLAMIDLNIRALTELTLRFLPQITTAKGRILNVASVAGFLPGPGMAVYYATKAFVVSYSEALWAELAETGVTISVLCPGVTRTNFQARAGVNASLLKAMPGMSAMAVAEAGYKGLIAGRRRIIPGFGNKLMVGLTPLLPNAVLLPIVARIQARRVATR